MDRCFGLLEFLEPEDETGTIVTACANSKHYSRGSNHRDLSQTLGVTSLALAFSTPFLPSLMRIVRLSSQVSHST